MKLVRNPSHWTSTNCRSRSAKRDRRWSSTRARTYAGHRPITSGRSHRTARAGASRNERHRFASCHRAPRRPGTLDALAGVVAIAAERAQFLEERKEAELARKSEELKSALLASDRKSTR